MSDVDDALSEIDTYRTYLQHPSCLEPDLRHLVGSSAQESDAKSKISQEVEEVMESLDGSSEDVTAARRGDLEQVLGLYLFKTKLKEHQLKGIEFILGREDEAVATETHRHMLMSILYRSLLKFLRFEPFCQSNLFEQHIVKPFRQEQENQPSGLDGARNLKIMLKACCLRRTQAKLDLPPSTIERVDVAPTETEKSMFTSILDQCKEDFDQMAGKEGNSKKSNILFSAIMKLRRVCNHGAIPMSARGSKRTNQLAVPKSKGKASRSPSAEPACEFCDEKTGNDDILGGLDSCPICGRLQSEINGEASSLAPSPRPAPSPTPSMMDIDTPESSTDEFYRHSGLELKHKSSKMSAVVDNIKKTCMDAGSKSVVFSSWRDTLDILAAILGAEGIAFVQVDGRNPLLGRTELLTKFCQDPMIRVLLISINTGAVGLTLTQANMVHIVEPQWNPAIEEQAIARVVRMGQKRPVTIFKYMTAGSIENVGLLNFTKMMETNFVQTVVKLQEKKTCIVKLSMQDKDGAESDANLDSFKFAIDPNEWGAVS
ncbi:hypothetical protein FMEXI_12872 [Fusarium mexicanum]|uniref:Helicase C-terminal domain-containing protein n=1 Tax=Fusarium mexicanum TaxID=751941 RepID=A0A8H5MIU9_9HYPO|nr:hypothetical protein FMEXI_12872 [Fusarium mexicanum]